MTTNGHQTTSSHNNHLRVVQMQEQQQPWSNSVLNPIMVDRMNENTVSMPIDDDEDPSGAIDALVGRFLFHFELLSLIEDHNKHFLSFFF